MEVHGGTPRLEVADIFANDGRGVVLTQEAGTTGGKQLTLTSVHPRGFPRRPVCAIHRLPTPITCASGPPRPQRGDPGTVMILVTAGTHARASASSATR